MSRTLRIFIQTFAITLLLVGASKATGDSELTIDKILTDLNDSNSVMIEKLLKRKTTLFMNSELIVDQQDLADVLVALIDSGDQLEKDFLEKEIEKDEISLAIIMAVEANIEDLLSDNDDVVKQASEKVFNETDPIIRKFIFQELNKNPDAGQILEVLSEVQQTTELYISQNLGEAFEKVEENIGMHISNLTYLFQFDLDYTINEAIKEIFDKVFTETNLVENNVEEELNKADKLYNSLVTFMAAKEINSIVTPNLRRLLIINIKRAIRFDNNNFDSFTAGFLKIIAKQALMGGDLATAKKCEFLDIIMNAFIRFYEQETNSPLTLLDNLHRFMVMRYAKNEGLNLKLLSSNDQNKNNQLILELINHLTHTVGFYSKKSEDMSINIKNNCFMSDENLTHLIDNIDVVLKVDSLIPLRIDTNFYYPGEYLKDFKVLNSEGIVDIAAHDANNKQNFELNEIFYQFWLAFVNYKKDKLTDQNLDAVHANEFLNKMKDDIEGYPTLYDLNLQQNYGLLKFIIMFGFKGGDNPPQFDFDQSNYPTKIFIERISSLQNTTLYKYFITFISKKHSEITEDSPESELIKIVKEIKVDGSEIEGSRTITLQRSNSSSNLLLDDGDTLYNSKVEEVESLTPFRRTNEKND